MTRLERTPQVPPELWKEPEVWEKPKFRKIPRPILELPQKPGWQLLIEGFLLLVLGFVAVGAFAALVFAITGLR